MTTNMKEFLDYAVHRIKSDESIPEEFRTLPDDTLRAYAHKVLAEKVYDDIMLEHTLQLAQIVVELAKIQAMQE